MRCRDGRYHRESWYRKWFKGREMALAMGSEMALARLGVATCMIFSPFFAKLGGEVSVSRSVAFGVVLLCIALIMLVVYFFMDKSLMRKQVKLKRKMTLSKYQISVRYFLLWAFGSCLSLRTLLQCDFPIPEICGKYAAMQPHIHRGSC